MKRSLFQKHQFRGWYGEDLNLGIELIKANCKLAFLSSCMVIHSHNREPMYHLRRGIVDVIYLKEEFDDYTIETADSTMAIVEIILNSFDTLNLFVNLSNQMDHTNIVEFKRMLMTILDLRFDRAKAPNLDVDPGINQFANDLRLAAKVRESQKANGYEHQNITRIGRDRIANFLDHLSEWYGELDSWMISMINQSLIKVVAANAGIHLAGCLNAKDIHDYPDIIKLKNNLMKGV